MSSPLQRRLARLEQGVSRTAPEEPHPFAKKLLEELAAHKVAGTRYAATDEEIDLLAALSAVGDGRGPKRAAAEQEGGLEGVYELPSGVRVQWIYDGRGYSIHGSARAELADLPEGSVRPFIERADSRDPGEGDR